MIHRHNNQVINLQIKNDNDSKSKKQKIKISCEEVREKLLQSLIEINKENINQAGLDKKSNIAVEYKGDIKIVKKNKKLNQDENEKRSVLYGIR